MLGARVKKQYAERASRFLKAKKLLDGNHQTYARGSFVYFPILRGADSQEKHASFKKLHISIEKARFDSHDQNNNYRKLLLDEFGKKKYRELVKGFDMLGNIAIIDSDAKSAKKIARIIMATHKNVETVLGKKGAVGGRYRTRDYAFVLGKRNYIAGYNENGASFVFDVRKVFFSPRLAYERKRVAELSKNGENVIVMFAGIGPFAVEIAKRNRRSKVIAIELNRHAYKYMCQNVKINKVSNVIPVLGNVVSLSKKYKYFADRIIMPLPMDSYRFLDSALTMASRRCIMHYYAFVEGEDENGKEKIKKLLSRYGIRFRFIGSRTVRPYSSTIREVVFDIEIWNR